MKLDKGHLSHVLNGDADLSLGALKRILDNLGLVLWVRPKGELEEFGRFNPKDLLESDNGERER
jgi:hypothetical protein